MRNPYSIICLQNISMSTFTVTRITQSHNQQDEKPIFHYMLAKYFYEYIHSYTVTKTNNGGLKRVPKRITQSHNQQDEKTIFHYILAKYFYEYIHSYTVTRKRGRRC
eukprot:g998.t1